MSVEAIMFTSTNHPKFSAVEISCLKKNHWIVRDTSGRCSILDLHSGKFVYGHDVRTLTMPKDVALGILEQLDRDGEYK